MTQPASGPRLHLSVAISGATGMIGSALAGRLRGQGHEVRRLARGTDKPQPGDVRWDPAQNTIDVAALEGVDAVVHLAGAPIAQRWTSAHKREIRESRVKGTTLLANAIARMSRKPRVMLSGSAIGYYGNRRDEPVDESSAPGTDFLSRVACEWEEAAHPAADAGIRLVTLRTGIVLSPKGGVLEKLLPPFKLGLGGPMGSGRQWMSWISLEDHLRAMEHAIFTDSLRGPVNLVAPDPVTNADFAHTLGKVLSRPAIIPVPSIALELAFGEMADATILGGQKVRPAALLASRFTFAHPTLEEALRAELRNA